jgi:riboflavin synthase alpha subunit
LHVQMITEKSEIGDSVNTLGVCMSGFNIHRERV